MVSIPICFRFFIPCALGCALRYRVSEILCRLGTPLSVIGCAQDAGRVAAGSLANVTLTRKIVAAIDSGTVDSGAFNNAISFSWKPRSSRAARTDQGSAV